MFVTIKQLNKNVIIFIVITYGYAVEYYVVLILL